MIQYVYFNIHTRIRVFFIFFYIHNFFTDTVEYEMTSAGLRKMYVMSIGKTRHSKA
jgi:hypothetical protein